MVSSIFILLDPPSAPQSLNATVYACDAVHIDWKPSTYQKTFEVPLKYLVTVRSIEMKESINYTTVDTSLIINKLWYGNVYNISVQAIANNEQKGQQVFTTILLELSKKY